MKHKKSVSMFGLAILFALIFALTACRAPKSIAKYTGDYAGTYKTNDNTGIGSWSGSVTESGAFSGIFKDKNGVNYTATGNVKNGMLSGSAKDKDPNHVGPKMKFSGEIKETGAVSGTWQLGDNPIVESGSFEGKRK
ncbi:hypothetical protein [Treponema pedis]|uniref:hypothetical protein n=1 Tax=Treponema pedis TaxID=409322 RepID=UPI00041406BF|nr:hypothetical protein [Treponema pedis]